jgi:hypothetical protein
MPAVANNRPAADEMIRDLGDIADKVDAFAFALRSEIADTLSLWNGLGRVGGQRADHAADLMARLRPDLANICRYCHAIEAQITGMVANPFGRDE